MTTSGRTGTLTWYTVGEESARPLVLVHALGADSEMWDPQLPELSAMRRVVMVDLPGHGNSIAGPGPYTIRDLGEDVLDVATTAGAGEFDLCGMSLGGLISLWIAGHSPERVMSLVASNTAARIGTEEIWQARIDAVAGGGMEAVSEQALARFFTSGFASEHPDVFEPTSRALLATDPGGYAACCAALRDADLRELVEAIRCPTLVIAGTEDISTPLAESVWLHEHVDGSTLHILDGAPHFSNLEQPEAWTETAKRFLAAQNSG
jgi:3-oxoadipate enol-lactonase